MNINSKTNKNYIKIIGAQEHNLKNISVDIPKNSLTVITGPSGSGKSSLALDVLYTEGKRRYIESLSSYARQFLGLPGKPKVDRIEGLCPAIAIEQKSVGHNPRSTVGTITEIYDYLRVLFATIGDLFCPNCDLRITAESSSNISDAILDNFANKTITIVAPIAIYKKGEFQNEISKLFALGYYRFKIDGKNYKFSKLEEVNQLKLKKTERHNIDVILDLCDVTPEESFRVLESIENSFKITSGLCKVIVGEKEYFFSKNKVCLNCNYSFGDIEPRLFSFNSPIGACQNCLGLGMVNYDGWREMGINCSSCEGMRLNKAALSIKISNKNIYQLCQESIKDLLIFFKNLELDDHKRQVTKILMDEIVVRLVLLIDIGLGYLSLNRQSRTLSGGEGQRIRLATQIGSALSGVLYVLDEPSIGLHQRDNDRLIKTLHRLKDLGNTVVVVEHDIDTILASDYVIDMGPKAGQAGGLIIAEGTPAELIDHENSITGAYLSGKKAILIPEYTRKPAGFINLKKAATNNLKKIDVGFPLQVFCVITGVSGSGKSTLIMQELVPSINKYFNKRKIADTVSNLSGAESLKNMVVIDQSPIGRTSRSTPATYLGIFDDIRALFATLPESNIRGYKPGHFSFNVKEGRCEKCAGEGELTVSMHFLADVYIMCDRCQGARYNSKVLEIAFKNKNISQVLEMSVVEACEFFSAHSSISKKLKLLAEVGLDYLKLGQSSLTLSGGEAQRVKLAFELSKRGSDTLYILDEPTTGLHLTDIEKLLKVLQNLVDKKNSVLVIEHNLDVIKVADYIIDLGPEGGQDGGYVVAKGTPQQIIQSKQSHTGKYLKKLIK